MTSPGVNPVNSSSEKFPEADESSSQPISTNDPHAPLNILKTESVITVPVAGLVSIVKVQEAGTVTLYQTSLERFVATQDKVGRPNEFVALILEPVAGEASKFAPTVNSIAPVQSSLAGGGGGVPIQISKVVFCKAVAVVV